MALTIAVNRRTFAEAFYCPQHGEPGTTHWEPVWSLSINGANGQYEPPEDDEVEVCNTCNRKVVRKPKVDYSQLNEIPY